VTSNKKFKSIDQKSLQYSKKEQEKKIDNPQEATDVTFKFDSK